MVSLWLELWPKITPHTHHLTFPSHRKRRQRLLGHHIIVSILRSHLTDSAAKIQVFWSNLVFIVFFDSTPPYPKYFMPETKFTSGMTWFNPLVFTSRCEARTASRIETGVSQRLCRHHFWYEAGLDISDMLVGSHGFGNLRLALCVIGLTSEPCRKVVLQSLAKSSLRTSTTSRVPSISRWFPKYNS